MVNQDGLVRSACPFWSRIDTGLGPPLPLDAVAPSIWRRLKRSALAVVATLPIAAQWRVLVSLGGADHGSRSHLACRVCRARARCSALMWWIVGAVVLVIITILWLKRWINGFKIFKNDNDTIGG
jgi:hypothetical protein